VTLDIQVPGLGHEQPYGGVNYIDKSKIQIELLQYILLKLNYNIMKKNQWIIMYVDNGNYNITDLVLIG